LAHLVDYAHCNNVKASVQMMEVCRRNGFSSSPSHQASQAPPLVANFVPNSNGNVTLTFNNQLSNQVLFFSLFSPHHLTHEFVLDSSISSTTVDRWPDNIRARQGQTTSPIPWSRRSSANPTTRAWDRPRNTSLWCNSRRSCRFSRLRQCCLSSSSSTCLCPWWNPVADRCSSR
jgi:hypothetical protein